MQPTRYTKADRKTYFACSAEELAPWLLGKILCVRINNANETDNVVRVRIFETEAYGKNDSACYGRKCDGRQTVIRKTPANRFLFGEAGICCIYGGMLLITAGNTESPENVLIRGAGNEEAYCSGPVLLCEYLKIGKDFNGVDILSSRDIWLEDDSAQRGIFQTLRKGIGKNVIEEDKKRKWRFIAI